VVIETHLMWDIMFSLKLELGVLMDNYKVRGRWWQWSTEERPVLTNTLAAGSYV
jgi:hypothetical protein